MNQLYKHNSTRHQAMAPRWCASCLANGAWLFDVLVANPFIDNPRGNNQVTLTRACGYRERLLTTS